MKTPTQETAFLNDIVRQAGMNQLFTISTTTKDGLFSTTEEHRTPVLHLCRVLTKAGYGKHSLHVYNQDGSMLRLTVDNIASAAELSVSDPKKGAIKFCRFFEHEEASVA